MGNSTNDGSYGRAGQNRRRYGLGYESPIFDGVIPKFSSLLRFIYSVFIFKIKMKLQNIKDDLVIEKLINRSLSTNLNCRQSHKIKRLYKISGDLANIWRVCNYSSEEKYDKLFKLYKGLTLNQYCKKLNPSCKS